MLLDVEQFNRRWVDAEQTTSWSQLIIEHTADAEEIVTQVPATGIWRMEPDGTVQFSRPAFQPQAVASEPRRSFSARSILATRRAGASPSAGC